MTRENCIEKITTIKKGTFVTIAFKSYPKPLSAHKNDVIEKFTCGVYRIGISYINMKINEDKVVTNLPYGQYDPDYQNYIITHTNKSGEYKEFLRIYTTQNHKHNPKTFYKLNGEIVTKEFLIENGYISASKSNPTSVFNVEIKNLISIGK